MLIFDFFSGTGSSTLAFENAGDTVISFELDPQFTPTESVDILTLTSEYLIDKYGRPDFIWASPPCTAFSVASIGHHWISGGDFPQPRTEMAVFNQTLVAHTRQLISELQPRYGWLMENPRGMLRKLSVVAGLPRQTVTYCQYGDDRQKPTDIWGGGAWMDTETNLRAWSTMSHSSTKRFTNRHTGPQGSSDQINDSLCTGC